MTSSPSSPSPSPSPSSPASTGHDPVDDVAFVARVQRRRERDRAVARLVRRFAALIIVVVGGAILAAIAVPNFIVFNCRARQSEARTGLQTLNVAERSFYAERDRFTLDPQEMGWTLGTGSKRYAYFIRADKDGYEAVALGVDRALAGDLWRIGSTGEIEHLVEGCR